METPIKIAPMLDTESRNLCLPILSCYSVCFHGGHVEMQTATRVAKCDT